MDTSTTFDNDEIESEILLNWLETSVTTLFSATDSGPSSPMLAGALSSSLIAEIPMVGEVQSPHPGVAAHVETSYPSPLTPTSAPSAHQSRSPTPLREDSTNISISRVFGPSVPPHSPRPPVDLILLTGDSMIFYVDENTLLNASSNQFNGLLPLHTRETQRRIVFVPTIPSSELQVVLQCMYNVSMTAIFMPSLDAVLRGIDRLPTYGVVPKAVIKPSSHVFEHLLSCAPLHPLQVYSVAAFHDIYTLAVQASAHLLVIDLSRVTEELAERMGSKYLLKLVRLHLGRRELLKGLLAVEPELHSPTKSCGFEGQRKLKRGWNYGVARLCWLIKADTPASTIRDTIEEATSQVSCRDCVTTRDARLNALLTEWSLTNRTIH